MDRDRIASLVRSRRLKVGLTLEQIGESVGKTKGAIGHIETARYGSSTDTLVEVANALQARWEIRLIGVGEGAARDPSRQQLLDLVDSIVDRLKDKEIGYLLGIVKVYADELEREAAEAVDAAEGGIQGQSSR
jgi:transcriptional regulator with XRE-family HTH domain